MVDTLLQTKLHIPPLYHAVVPRSRLVQRLNDGLTRKVTLVSAPAGFGKTTLVAWWLQPRHRPEAAAICPVPPSRVMWVSLDEGDNEPARFWSYVITALNKLQPGIGRNALDHLSAPQPPPIELTLTVLVNELVAQPSDFVLVLDDYHAIENQEIHQAVTFLLEHMPPRMHVVITCRLDPPLPLARLRARGQLAELRAADLRFTLDETTHFLNRMMGLNLPDADVAALDTRLEGWIAGLQLAAISMQGRPNAGQFISNFSGSHRYILDYLAEEVLQPQPETVQTFLLQTAILDKLSGPLCDAVTGRAGSQRLLEQLARANLFITPLDDRQKWYRYHPLFADLLRHRLQQTPSDLTLPPGGVKELHRRAANWYQEHGFEAKAVDHALAAEDFEHARFLLQKNVQELFHRGHFSDLERWLNALPDELLHTDPFLGLLHAWLLFFAGRLDMSWQRLQAVEQAVNLNGSQMIPSDEPGHPLPQPMMLGAILALRAQFALIQGDLPRVVELSHRAMQLIPPLKAGGLLLHTLTVQNLGMVYWLLGESEAADRALSDVSLSAHTGPAAVAPIFAASNLAELRRLQGKLSQAATLYRRVLQLATKENEQQYPMIIAAAHAELGSLLYEWNELDEAEAHLQKTIVLSNRGAGLRNTGRGYFGLAQIYQARGKFEQAFDALRQIEQLVQQLNLGFPQTMVQAGYVHLWIARGQLEPVAAWVQSRNLEMEDRPDKSYEVENITLARALLALGNLEAAGDLLARLYRVAHQSYGDVGAIKIYILQAVLLQAQNNMPQALDALEQALLLAQPEGYIRSFVDEGDAVAALLLKYLDARQPRPGSSPDPAYINKLLHAFGINAAALSDSSAAASQPLPDPLTGRELEVLQLIAAGMSNQEIAGKLVVAKSTLKTHIKHIYGKLNARNRLEAVARAKELELL